VGHKVYISFKTEDAEYKDEIQSWTDLDYIDKSLNQAIDSTDPERILQIIRSDYLSTSTVTIFLIGSHSSENLGTVEQQYIKRELQGSLYNSEDNPKNGILGIVLPEMQSTIFRGTYNCVTCGNSHNLIVINDSTAIREFSYNYYIPNGKCNWSPQDRYCQLTTWQDFKSDPQKYIDLAHSQRKSPIANQTRVYPTSAGGSVTS
jgi:hypothetical protein